MPASQDSCPAIHPKAATETQYFVQMLPCVDERTDRIAVVRDLGETSELPPIRYRPKPQKRLGARYRVDPDMDLKDLIEKQNTFRRQIGDAVADPWKYTGLPCSEPYWSLGITYQQLWEHGDIHRGRIVASIPLGLYPSGRKISVKTWETVTRSSETSDVMEESRTTEISGNERLSASVQKQILTQSSAEYNPSATINNVSIPVKGAASVGAGGSLGISATFGDLDRRTVQRGSEFVREATLKAVESIKSARKVVVEVESEYGIETENAETLANPNRTNTLTYLYYELIEDYKVTVTPTALNLYVFVPLPIDYEVSPEWLLTNECLLRPHIDCDSLREGFGAAREILTYDRMEQRRREEAAVAPPPPSVAAGAPDSDLKKVVAALDSVIRSYEQLSGATTDGRFVGRWLYWELCKGLSEKLVDALESLDLRLKGSDYDEDDRQKVAAAVADLELEIGNVDSAFGRVNMAATAIVAGGLAIGYLPFAPIVLGILVVLELAGIDAIPDDAGLERKIEHLINATNALLEEEREAAELEVPAAVADGENAGLVAELENARREAQEEWRLLRAAAEVRLEALRSYVKQNIYHLHRVVWTSLGAGWVEQHLLSLGLSPRLFNLEFEAFEGEYGALRLVDLSRAEAMGFKAASLEKWSEQLHEDSARLSKSYDITAPAPGVVCEPLVGSCEGADEFIRFHRERDKELKLEAVAQAKIETERARARLDSGLLGDPRPFDRSESLTVSTEFSEEPAVPPANTDPADPPDD